MWAFLVVILIVLCHASLPAIGGPLCGSVLIKMHNLSASLRVLGNKVVAYDVHSRRCAVQQPDMVMQLQTLRAMLGEAAFTQCC